MGNVFQFPGEDPPSGLGGEPPSGQGGGPEGPDMAERVAKLEQQFAKIDIQLARLPIIEAQMAKATDVSEIKGQLSQLPKAVDFGRLEGRIQTLPTTLQLITALITTWAAGAAIVFTLLRLSGR